MFIGVFLFGFRGRGGRNINRMGFVNGVFMCFDIRFFVFELVCFVLFEC